MRIFSIKRSINADKGALDDYLNFMSCISTLLNASFVKNENVVNTVMCYTLFLFNHEAKHD